MQLFTISAMLEIYPKTQECREFKNIMHMLFLVVSNYKLWENSSFNSYFPFNFVLELSVYLEENSHLVLLEYFLYTFFYYFLFEQLQSWKKTLFS